MKRTPTPKHPHVSQMLSLGPTEAAGSSRYNEVPMDASDSMEGNDSEKVPLLAEEGLAGRQRTLSKDTGGPSHLLCSKRTARPVFFKRTMLNTPTPQGGGF